MKILALNSSPRPKSNVRIALETALEAAQAKGAETELIDLRKLKISPCLADDYCKAHQGKCAVDDDMQQIYEKILEADALLLGSPIYFFDVTAQLKAVIDRLYAFFGEESVKDTLTGKKLSIIATNGVMTPDMVLPALKIQAKGFELLGFETVDVEALGDNNVPESIKEKEDQLAKAKEIGENLL